MAYRIIESLILGDAEEITGLLARQSGKSRDGGHHPGGLHGPVPQAGEDVPDPGEVQAGRVGRDLRPGGRPGRPRLRRIVTRLTSEHAEAMLLDPEIDERVDGKSKVLRLASGSFCRRQTANPRAKIEGASYHIIIIDECQDADETVIRKSIHPMLAFYAGTIVKIGTPGYDKGDFYKAINVNKRRQTNRRARQNHFEFDYRTVCKYNPNYAQFIHKEKRRLGEDSDEFQMSYALKWMLERGMLITEDDLDYLADPSMQLVRGLARYSGRGGHRPGPSQGLHGRHRHVGRLGLPGPRRLPRAPHPQLAGDPQHRVGGAVLGDHGLPRPLRHRLHGGRCPGHGIGGCRPHQRLMGCRCEVIPFSSDSKNQSERWKHLIQLIQRKMFVYPGHSKARRTRVWRRFRQQMVDAEKVMKGQYLLIEAPNEREAHDDYVDSAALACACSMMETVPWSSRSAARSTGTPEVTAT